MLTGGHWKFLVICIFNCFAGIRHYGFWKEKNRRKVNHWLLRIAYSLFLKEEKKQHPMYKIQLSWRATEVWFKKNEPKVRLFSCLYSYQ